MANNINVSLVLRSKNFVNQLAKTKRSLTTLEQTTSTIGRTMQYALGGALIAVAADASKAAAEFDLTNRKLAALAGNEGGVGALEKTARRLGETSVFTAAEVSAVQLEMKKLGLTVRDVDQVTEGVIKFATAMDTDVDTAGATLVKNLNRFGNTFDEFASKADATAAISEQFAFATLNSALNFDTLSAALGYTGGEANAAGFSFAETTAILAKLADAGFEGSRAGTILRRILINLAKDGVVNLRDGFGDLIENQQEFNELIKITGARSAGGIASIQGLRDAVDEFAKATVESEGGIERLFGAVDQSLIGRLKNLRSAIQEVGIKFLDAFGPQLNAIISNVASFIRNIDATDVAVAKGVLTFFAINKALSTFGNIAIVVAGRIKALAGSMALLSPQGALVTAAIAGISIIVASMTKWESKVNAIKESVEELKTVFDEVADTESPFNKALADKSFDSFEDFQQQATDELVRLGEAASATRADLDKLYSQKRIENYLDAVRKGVSIQEIFNKKVEEGKIGGLFQEDEEQFKTFLLGIDRIVRAEGELENIRKLMLDASTGKATFWNTVTYDVNELLDSMEKIGAINSFVQTSFDRLTFGKDFSDAIDASEELEARTKALNKELRKLEEDQLFFKGLDVADPYTDDRIDAIKNELSYLKLRGEALEEWKQKLLDGIGNEGGTPINTLLEGLEGMGLTEPLAEAEQAVFDFYLKATDGATKFNQKVRDSFAGTSLTITEQAELIFQKYAQLFSAFQQISEVVGKSISSALLDPATSFGEAMKEALRNLARAAIQWAIQIAALTGLIALGNVITGGGLSAFLNLTAGSQSLTTQGANALAQGQGLGDLGFLANGTRAAVSGNELVFATTRGYNINSRVYG